MIPLISSTGSLPKPERGIFLTGTGTNVGKTHVAAALMNLWEADYWKPIQSGWMDGMDRDTVRDLSGILDENRFIPEVYNLALPASPHQAADFENLTISLDKICLPERARPLIVEGAGGLMVPLTQDIVLLDLVEKLGLPVWVVSGVYLGSINHTMLTLEMLKARNIPVAGVIFSGPRNRASEEVILARYQMLSPEWWVWDWTDIPQVGTPNRSVTSKKAPIVHPFTRYGEEDQMLEVTGASGAWLTLSDGRRLVDACGSWWTNIHGHCHPALVAKVSAQMQRLDHVIFAGITHPPAEALAHALVHFAGAPFSRVFFSDNGSTSVEVALKLTWQWWKNQGETRTRFIALSGAYHGDTFGAMAVGERDVFVAPFEDLLFEVAFLPFPEKGQEEAVMEALEKILATSNPAAFIYEPLIQGAAGMRMMDAGLLSKILARCRAAGVLLIADEVFTGFGRTGKDLASHWPGLTPDVICLSKALTGGMFPLGATLFTEKIYAPFKSHEAIHQFFHGHSYTGHPIACAAGLAQLEWYQSTRGQMERILHGQKVAGLAAAFQDHPGLTDVRHLGAVVAADVRTAHQGYFYHDPLRKALYTLPQEAGVLFRPLGNVIYAVPPYPTDEVAWDCIEKGFQVAANLGIHA